MAKFITMLALIIGGIALLAGFALLCALPTMWLWNYLMPDLFHLAHIGFWQAFAMNWLCGILFKGSSTSSSK